MTKRNLNPRRLLSALIGCLNRLVRYALLPIWAIYALTVIVGCAIFMTLTFIFESEECFNFVDMCCKSVVDLLFFILPNK